MKLIELSTSLCRLETVRPNNSISLSHRAMGAKGICHLADDHLCWPEPGDMILRSLGSHLVIGQFLPLSASKETPAAIAWVKGTVAASGRTAVDLLTNEIFGE